ncbi:hypothetical protein PF003_g10977 [Phytophthora fragariae]|nr:hypothetical protein PF003_g10977 [Phytophthora fragariae]
MYHSRPRGRGLPKFGLNGEEHPVGATNTQLDLLSTRHAGFRKKAALQPEVQGLTNLVVLAATKVNACGPQGAGRRCGSLGILSMRGASEPCEIGRRQ